MAPIILRLASSPAGPIAALIGDRARLWMRGADSANTHPRRDSSHFGRKNRHRAAKQREQCFDGQRHASDTLPPPKMSVAFATRRQTLIPSGYVF